MQYISAMQRTLLPAERDTTFPFVLASGYFMYNRAWDLILDGGLLIGWLTCDRDVESGGEEEEERNCNTQKRTLSTVGSLLSFDLSNCFHYGWVVDEGRTLVGRRKVKFARAYTCLLVSTYGKAGDGSSSASSKALLSVGPDL
jgi:hypothetical protein